MPVRNPLCLKVSVAVATALVALFGLASRSIAADEGAVPLELLTRCTAMKDDDARLRCYDALVQHYQAGAAVAAPSAPSAPSPIKDRNFGFSAAKIRPAVATPLAIQARITAISLGRGEVGQAYVELDNGQVWRTRDDVGRLAAGTLVKIKQAALGSFLLLDPANLSYRVYRVK